MAIKLVKGDQLIVTYRLKDENDDPLYLPNSETIYACIKDTSEIHKKRLLRTGDTTDSSPVIASVDTDYCEIGDLVAGTGIPTGSKILTIDTMAGTITLDQNATADGTGVTLTIGDGEVITGATQIGKFKITVDDTSGLTAGETLNSEVILVTSGVKKTILVPNAVQVLAAYC